MKEDKTTELLPIMEAFYTIQGEGHYTGSPAYFIRLGGCDVGCAWCDVKDSWDADLWPKESVADIVSKANEFPGKLAVVTGGEPLMYDMSTLCTELQSKGFKTNIETSGAYALSGNWDWICFSPKKFKKPLPEFYENADELKIIIFNKSDLKWAEEHAANVNNDCLLYLQPEWDKAEEMLPFIIDYVKLNPRWKISLQTHKFMNIP